jgi:hypothetical protein
MAFNLQDYETVEDRLARYWEQNPNGRIFTELISHEGGQYIIKAFLFRDAGDQVPWSTGYAEETVSTRGVNQTSALENGETSAIGRALANAGFAARGKRPSREEMAKVQRGQTPTTIDPGLALIKGELAKMFKTADERKSWLEFQVGRDLSGLSDLTPAELETVSKVLTSSTKEAN